MTTSPGHDPLHSAGPPATGATPAAGAGDVRTPPPTGDVRTPHATGTGPSPDAGIGELVSNITNDFSILVRQELELAKAELSQTISKAGKGAGLRSEEHTSELQSRGHLVCRLLLEKKHNTLQ